MPFVAVPNTVKLVIRGVSDNQAVVNVLHYKYTTAPPSASTLNAFLTTWLGNHAQQWYNCHGANYALLGLDATDLSSSGGAYATVNVAGPGNTGAMGGAALPNNVAYAVSWRTGLSGRKHRGRTYLGGLTNAAAAADVATGPFLTAITTLANSLIAITENTIFDFAITSLVDHISVAVTGYVLETIMDSMRRRLPGRGI